MITKTAMIVNFLLEKINSFADASDCKLPSQQQLMKRFNCSRVTVLRALDILKKDGLITGNQGRGTYITSREKVRRIEEIIVIKDSSCGNTESFDNAISSLDNPKLPIRWLDAQHAMINSDKFFQPWNGVIWLWAPLRHLHLMEYLKKRSVPQLLLNRDYKDFDYIATDSKASIREGLTWLLIESGRNISFISRKPSIHYPFLPERIIGFYECCFETGTMIPAERIYMSEFYNITEDIQKIGKQFFDCENPPRGIFVMNREFALPVVLCASQYGLQLGKDFFLLVFDDVPELYREKGFAEMHQATRPFRDGISQWLSVARESDRPLFTRRLKTHLQIHN